MEAGTPAVPAPLAPDRRPFAEIEVGEHRLALLKDGLQAYPAMLAAIASARSTICFETYILKDDATGLRFAEALRERARAGVEVSLMYDAWGSSISGEFLAALAEAGVRTVAFRPVRFAGRLGRIVSHLWRRNHRKSLTVDRLVGFTGGMNIADEYAAKEDGGVGWRDTHVRIEGPAALELQHLFIQTWERNGGAKLDAPRYAHSGRRPTAQVKVIGSELREGKKLIRRAYLEAIDGARERIRITNAYFLPTFRVLRSLRAAARRGVDVSVIVAGTTDVQAVLHAGRAIYGRLLRSGIRVYEWQGRVLHAKTAVVDGRWATVGSSNLDTLSLRVNLEVNAVVEDPRFAAAVEAMFEEDLAHCEEITRDWMAQRSLGTRLLSWFAYFFRDWL